jgi:DNA-binding transcriptional LysR family regulator
MEFAKRLPGLRVHLFVLEESSTSSENGFDVIVSGRRSPPPGLAGHDLGPVEHVICASPAYLRHCGRPREPQELRKHNCLANMYSGPKEWPFKLGSRALQIEVKGSLSSNSYSALVQMAVDGCGIIRAPRHAVGAELERKALETILEGTVLSPERICIYYSKSRHLPAKTSEFIQFLRGSFVAA